MVDAQANEMSLIRAAQELPRKKACYLPKYDNLCLYLCQVYGASPLTPCPSPRIVYDIEGVENVGAKHLLDEMNIKKCNKLQIFAPVP